MRQDDFCNITWSVNSTGGLHAIWKLDALFGSNLSEANDTGDISMEITKVVIISLGWDTTNFGAVDAMSTGNPAQENGPGYDITIDPNSNDIDGLYVKGTDLAPASVSGFEDISYGIGVGNITWNHYDNYSDSRRLTTEYARMNESLPCSTTVKSYYWIDIPRGQYTQEYSGKLYIMANAST